MAEVGGMSTLSQGINDPPFQLSYMLLPSAPHLVTVWPFGKKGKKTSCLGISKNSIFTRLVTSAIPPEPLFSLLTNIPQVTFPICLKSDSLTGVSVGNVGNSQGVVTFTIETDGKPGPRDFTAAAATAVASVVSDSSQPHGLQPTRLLRPWDFPGKSTGVGCHCLLQEISPGYYDLAQSLGTRGSGRTDTLYLTPNMRLSSDAINQSQKSMFCSGRPKNHICSSWFLNRAGNSDHCYSLVGVPTPENLTLCWEPKRNTLYLEDKTQVPHNT